MVTYSGIGVSRGISIAPVFQFVAASIKFETVQVSNPEVEWKRYQQAVLVTLGKLEKIYEKAVLEIGTDEAAIFHAHIAILQDPELNDGVQSQIMDETVNAESALFEVSEEYCHMLEEIDDEYLKERAVDIRDVRNSVLKVLLGIVDDPACQLQVPSIIISRDLTPSDCLSMDRHKIAGFCTIEGGATSHTTILARSLGVPALVGADAEVITIVSCQEAILDGFTGKIIVDPDEETLARYRLMQSAKAQIMQKAQSEAKKAAITLDNHKVDVFANIGSDSAEDLQSAVNNGAEGVGLLRTEFIYLDCTKMPDEEYQYKKYAAVAEAFGDKPVILRTLDIGGDKQLPYLELPYELNPFLGVRGLRLCLRNTPLFKTQLRAALRAGQHGNLQIMFPMVTKADEIRQARALINECRQELIREGKRCDAKIEIGIMIEIPAAALLADRLAPEVDFFSIGTNDLSQYTLAVDRTNSTLANLANAYDPAVLKLIQSVVQGAHAYGKIVGVCGELAGEPLAIPILVGLGVDELSMNPSVVPLTKQIVRRLNMKDSQALAEKVLLLETPSDVRAVVSDALPFLQEYS
jgi:phosphotransferase system enzyme I (PtsI)